MLKSHRCSPSRRRAGRAVALGLGLLALGAGPTLQAAQDAAGPPQSVMLTLAIDQDGRPLAAPRLFGAMGQPVSVRWTQGTGAAAAPPWELEVTTSAQDGGRLRLQARLSSGTPPQLLAAPALVTGEGQAVRFETRSADGLHVIGVSLTARRATAPDKP